MELDDIVKQLNNAENIKLNHFKIIKAITAIYNNSNEQNLSKVQELILRAMDKYEFFGESRRILDSLIRELGLFPYLSPDKLSFQDLLAYETHKTSIGKDDIVFHAPQAEVYYKLINGQSVVLSAPTSFGKSLIIDALIASGKFNNIVIVVPTISLIDETRRRLSKFNSEFKIITHSLQLKEQKNIYVLTQERVLESDFIGTIDFFVIDEFYKLSPWAGDENRCSLLNEAFYRLYKSCSHFYMLAPNIQGVTGDFIEKVKCEFIKFSYNTVVTEFHDYTTKQKENTLIDICSSLDGQTIIFCSSPKRANSIAKIVSDISNRLASKESLQLAEWLAENYHDDWVLTNALKKGIGVHHARIPRGVSQYLVDLFNQGKLQYLICTSTLIEGVNTSTKNIICYDDRINRKKIDFFTFNNIAGRSGRMSEHFIGHVYLLSPPPLDNLPVVDIPVFTQDLDTPESLLINMDKDDLSPQSSERIKAFTEQSYLSLEIIKENKAVEPNQQLDFAKWLNKHPEKWSDLLIWKGYPEYAQLKYICSIIWEHFSGSQLGNGSVASYSQLAFKINELSKKKSISTLINEVLVARPDDNIDMVISRILDFRRLWANFNFPRLLRAIGSIVNDVQKSRGLTDFCDYSVYSVLVENYHYDTSLVALEEYGLPLEISCRLKNELSNGNDLDQSILALKNLETFDGLSAMDINFILRAKKGLF